MTQPVAAAAPPSMDPYGLWAPEHPVGAAAPSTAGAEGAPVSYGEPAGALPGDEADLVAVWRLPLWSDDPGAGKAELDRRARKLAAIVAGLAEAGPRAEAFQVRRNPPGGEAPVSYGLDTSQPGLPDPEAELAYILDAVEHPAGEVAFGIGETAAQLAGVVGVDWNGMQERFTALIDSVNRQLLHAAWVETTLDGRLVARTTIDWGGDLTTHKVPGLEAAALQAHQASLEQAIASEEANLKTVLTVVQVAGKIALATTTPLGMAQALVLAYQFVKTIVNQ